MKTLLYKEWKLAMHPTVFIFIAFGAMLLIPSYPYFVSFFYTTLAIFFIFLTGRENRDIEFTALLPIRKRDCVYARFLLVVLIELAQILISIPFALLSVQINPNGTNFVGMDISVAFYGLVFLFYTLFNITFVVPFYKTAYKIGQQYLLSSILLFVFIIIVEVGMHIMPALANIMDTSDSLMQIKQLPILLFCILVYVLTTFFGAKKAAYNFEKVDL